MNNFKYENDKIYSLSSGDLVAVIENGNLKIQPGKNALTPRIKAFYEECVNNTSSDGQALPSGGESLEKEPDSVVAAKAQAPAEEEEVNTHLLSDEAERERIAWGDAPRPGGTAAPAREYKPSPQKSAKALSVWDIPEESLPEFRADMGVETPDFKNFVKKHKFNKEQTIELIKRLERKGR